MTTAVYYVIVVVLFAATMPVQFVIACLVWITSGSPVLFRQKRIGKNGKPFVLYKFRTMVPDAERKQRDLSKRNEATGPAFKIHNDPRFTRIGVFLSHTGLDELPQLWNMLRGEMVIIGPRPLPVDEAKKLKPWMREREKVLPGIISPAILTGRYHSDFTAWMKSDVSYVQRKNVFTDIGIAIRMIPFLGKLLLKEVAP